MQQPLCGGKQSEPWQTPAPLCSGTRGDGAPHCQLGAQRRKQVHAHPAGPGWECSAQSSPVTCSCSSMRVQLWGCVGQQGQDPVPRLRFAGPVRPQGAAQAMGTGTVCVLRLPESVSSPLCAPWHSQARPGSEKAAPWGAEVQRSRETETVSPVARFLASSQEEPRQPLSLKRSHISTKTRKGEKGSGQKAETTVSWSDFQGCRLCPPPKFLQNAGRYLGNPSHFPTCPSSRVWVTGRLHMHPLVQTWLRDSPLVGPASHWPVRGQPPVGHSGPTVRDDGGEEAMVMWWTVDRPFPHDRAHQATGLVWERASQVTRPECPCPGRGPSAQRFGGISSAGCCRVFGALCQRRGVSRNEAPK